MALAVHLDRRGESRFGEPEGLQRAVGRRLRLDGDHLARADPADHRFDQPEVRPRVEGFHDAPVAVRLREAQPVAALLDGETRHVGTGEFQDRPVAQLERGAVERRLDEAGDEDHPAPDGRVVLSAGRRLVSDGQGGRVAIGRRERDAHGRLGQSERRQVRGLVLDHPPDLERGQGGRDGGRRVVVRLRCDGCGDLPVDLVLRAGQHGDVAVRRVHREVGDPAGRHVERLFVGVRLRRGRPFAFDEPGVAADGEEERQQHERRAQASHGRYPRRPHQV